MTGRWAGRLIAILLAVGVIVVAGLVAYRWSESDDESGGKRGSKEQGPVPVRVAPVASGAIRERRWFHGSLQASAQQRLAPQVAGRVASVAVDRGDRVVADQVLLRLQPAELRLERQGAEAAVALAESEIAAAESRLPQLQREAERQAALRQRGVASTADDEMAQAALVEQQAAVAVARARLQATEARLAGAIWQLQQAELRPLDLQETQRWLVGERLVDPGELVGVGEPVVELVRVDPLQAEILVSEAAYRFLQRGQAAELSVAAWPGETFPATVSRLRPVFDPRTRLVPVELAVANAEDRLRPGMFVRLAVTVASAADATLVPETAIISRLAEPAVFLVDEDGSRVRRVAVELGLRDAGMVQISGAEAIGGLVVVLGQQLLTDGATIVIPDEDGEPSGAGRPEATAP